MNKVYFYQIKKNIFSDEYVRSIYQQFASDYDLNQLLSSYKIKNESLLEEIILNPNFGIPDLCIVVKYQKLSVQFIKKYILNPEWQTNDNEKNITFEEIKYYQGYDKSLLL